MTNRMTDLSHQGFMKPAKQKRTYAVGLDSIGIVNSGISNKSEALKVARAYVAHQNACDYNPTYIYVKDELTNSTIAAYELKVHKWARVL